MKREILFRAKIAGTDTWIYGLPYAVYSDNEVDSIQSIETKQVEYIRKDTLAQFTGLKDKNGVKIFEGDVFKLRAKTDVFEVCFEYGCFLAYVGEEQHSLVGILRKHFIEVIGNIHDNPELLTLNPE